MDEFEARFESLRAQFKDYGSLYDENFEGRFTREDCREVLAMVDNLPADDVASKPGFKARQKSKLTK
ncbi:myosin, light chain 2, 20 kDa [Corchorus olitorius]|uniref:Myosin, light chain 2, 20 kDa n=1 Tax=Corchorus olitorius TaxID=93759 RepID=A0A1R3K9V5_9ROSI|nr:myosin, light chain 2, 20 kDa [Corchorus olitorius]